MISKFYFYLTWALRTAVFPPETEMALALYSCSFSHPLMVPLEAVFHSPSPDIGGIGEKPQEKRARAIWMSIYCVNWTKIEIFLWKWQFSPHNKHFFIHIYLQKKFCSFSFLRPKFSFGTMFRQFGNFPKSSCQLIVLHFPLFLRLWSDD